MHHDNAGALHITVLHTLPGRVRLLLEKPAVNPMAFRTIRGVTDISYNPRLQTLLVTYDTSLLDERQLLFRIAASYVSRHPTQLLHVKHAEEKSFSLPPSGALALLAIAADGAVTLAGASVSSITHWVSVAGTLSAVIEHGYTELHQRGSFDPEVMSVIYLINSIGKANMLQASVIAWIVTFGRHIIPR